MAEGGEGAPVQLKPKEVAQLQKLAPVVMLGERARGQLTSELDRKRYESARQHLEIGNFTKALESAEGDNRILGRNLRGMVEKFGIRDSSGTKDRPTDADSAYVRAKKGLDIIVPILQADGFNKLDTAQQDTIRAHITNVLAENPNFAAFQGMDDDQKKEFVNECLRNPAYRAKFVGVLKEIQGMPLVTESDILAAQKEYDLAEARHREAEIRAKQLDKAAKATKKKLNPDTEEETVLTPQQQELSSQIEDAKDVKKQYEEAINTLKQEIVDLEKTGKGELTDLVKKQYATATSRLKIAEDAVRQYTAEISKLTRQLDTAGIVKTDNNEPDLEAKLDEQQEKASQARINAAGGDAELRAAYNKLEELKEERAHQEEAIADSIDGAFSKAATEFIQESLRTAMDSLVAQEGQVQEAQVSSIQKELKRHLETRWGRFVTRPQGIFRRSRRDYVQNKALINQDCNALLSRGDDEVMRNILSQLRPEQNGQRAALDEASIDALMKNKVFAEQMKTQVIKQIIARRGLISGFRPGELQQMMSMDAVKDIVQSSLDQNGDFRKQVATLAESEDMDMDSPAFRDRFSRIAASRPGLLLFPLTTIPWTIWSALRASRETRSRTPRQDLADQIAA